MKNQCTARYVQGCLSELCKTGTCKTRQDTSRRGQSSSVAAIMASIIQGSGLGPASYIITAADLHPATNRNRIVKFADDTYLVVPASNSSSQLLEIDHIQTWAAGNNLMLNCSKSRRSSSLHEASVESQFNYLHVVSTSNV